MQKGANMVSKTVKHHAILVSLEGYLYLQDRCKLERCGKHDSEAYVERLKHSFEQFSHNGYKRLMDGDLGGCENGRWTNWTAEQMSKMLTEQGLDWKPTEDVECVEVGI